MSWNLRNNKCQQYNIDAPNSSCNLLLLGKINFEDLFYNKTPYDSLVSYRQSKLANLLFSRELARRTRGKGFPAPSSPSWQHKCVIIDILGCEAYMHKIQLLLTSGSSTNSANSAPHLLICPLTESRASVSQVTNYVLFCHCSLWGVCVCSAPRGYPDRAGALRGDTIPSSECPATGTCLASDEDPQTRRTDHHILCCQWGPGDAHRLLLQVSEPLTASSKLMDPNSLWIGWRHPWVCVWLEDETVWMLRIWVEWNVCINVNVGEQCFKK